MSILIVRVNRHVFFLCARFAFQMAKTCNNFAKYTHWIQGRITRHSDLQKWVKSVSSKASIPLNSSHSAFNPSVAVLRMFNVAQNSCYWDLIVTHLGSKATFMWASGNEVNILGINC